MEAVYQHPRDLSLVLTRGTSRQLITRLETAHLDVGSWRLSLSVIGESHVAQVAHDGRTVLTELLFCELPQPEPGAIVRRFEQMEAACFERGGYRVCLTFHEPDWQVPPSTRANTLDVLFPAVFGQIPLTRLQWNHDNERLLWWTLHTYPQPDAIIYVYTHSTFNMEDTAWVW